MKKRLERVFLSLLLISFSIFFIISCSFDVIDNENINQTNETEEKEALYGQALMELTEDNSTNNANLDKRFNYLQNQVNKILEGEEELKMAAFTRIKIELDYLSTKNYDSKKMKNITNSFMKAFAEAEKLAEEKDWGSSLGDRYSSLNNKIETFSSEEMELKVVEYLQVEKGLNKLEDNGYPIPSKIDDLRNKLFKAVIVQLESAIVNYEIPEIEDEVVLEEEIEEEIEAVEEKVIEKVSVIEEPTGPQTYIVKLIDGGFETELIRVNTGDTVIWENIRGGNYNIALVLGNRECRDVKSKLFRTGELYNFTFTEPMTCYVSDGIFTTQAMRVIVS